MPNDYDKFGADIDKRLDTIEQNYNPPPKIKIFSKLGLILFQPKKFYEKIKEMETDLFGALKYIVIFLAFFSVFRMISTQYQYASSLIDIIMIPFQSFFMWAIFCIGLLAYQFILVGILHLIVKIVGGKSGYYQTFKAFVYGFTPILLIGWIPNIFVLIPILLYSLILQIVGISKLQEISYIRAILTSVWLPIATLYLFNFLTAS
jgi:hypothetical protein|tara:strand:- start:723 stop:1337 length:615 start_codon:yes stop_codon:yes gene_type:complete